MHGNALKTPPRAANPVDGRISRLSLEFIDATPARQEEIGQEIEALISGKLSPLSSPGAPR